MKTITVEDETWKMLTRKKLDDGAENINEVILHLLNKNEKPKK